MEESEKMNGKKKLPSIPSNYVTLLQLRERWNQEKERKEKQEPQQQKQQEKETKVEDSSVPGRGTRNNHQFNRDNEKRVAEGKPRDDKTAAEDLDNEKKGEQLKKKKNKKNDRRKKSKEKKRNEMEEKARAANEGENTGNAPLLASTERDKGEEQLIRCEVHAPKLASGKEKDVGARKEWKPRLNPTTHEGKFQATKLSKGEVELIGDEVHAPVVASVEEENIEARRESRPKLTTTTHRRKAEIRRKFQATESSKGEEELIGDEAHAPMLASVKEKNVEVRRESESQPRFNPITHGRTAEIGLKFEAMSMNGGMRKGGNRRYDRQHFNFNQRRGGNWEANRRRDVNRINEGMVWVKKVEVEDQSSSKEL